MTNSIRSVRTYRWNCPFFETIMDTILRHLEIDRSSQLLDPNITVVYTLEEGFHPSDRSWLRHIQLNRMAANSNILYRPQIVNDLVKQIEKIIDRGKGHALMVSGAQGVGKSHSLINLTRYLLASGKYMVTIIPDCGKWYTTSDFFDYILESVGVNPRSFGITHDEERDKDFWGLFRDIDYLLHENGRKWVLIFDQVNGIFDRDEFTKERRTGNLPYPFTWINVARSKYHMISITAEPAHNDCWYARNCHWVALKYEHPLRFDRNEVVMLYPSALVSSWGKGEELEYATGRVPWYLCRWATNATHYYDEVRKEIEYRLNDRKSKSCDRDWQFFVHSAAKCVMCSWWRESTTIFNSDIDLIFMVRFKTRFTEKSLVTLSPFVDEVYRDNLWNDIMHYISENKRDLLDTCHHDFTTQDARGRMFQHVVLAQLYPNGIPCEDFKKLLTGAGVPLTKDVTALLQGGVDVQRFVGQSYPNLGPSQNGIVLFIPKSLHFPDVDAIFCVGNVVIAFHIYVSERPTTVLPSVQRHVQEANWEKDGIQKIILVYLSPNFSTTLKLKRKQATCRASLLGFPISSFHSTMEYVSMFCSIHDFNCLASINQVDRYLE